MSAKFMVSLINEEGETVNSYKGEDPRAALNAFSSFFRLLLTREGMSKLEGFIDGKDCTQHFPMLIEDLYLYR